MEGIDRRSIGVVCHHPVPDEDGEFDGKIISRWIVRQTSCQRNLFLEGQLPDECFDVHCAGNMVVSELTGNGDAMKLVDNRLSKLMQAGDKMSED